MPMRLVAVVYLLLAVLQVQPDSEYPLYQLPFGGRVTYADLAMIYVLIRSVIFNLRETNLLFRLSEYWAPLGLFFGYLLTSIAGSVAYGSDYMQLCLVSLARLAVGSLIAYSLASGLRTRKAIEFSTKAIVFFLVLNAGIIYFNVFGSKSGFIIGEVQGLEAGAPRYFGPVGDSITYMLVLGLLVMLMRGHFFLASVFFFAMLLTGTFGGLTTLAIGALALVFFRRSLRISDGAVTATRQKLVYALLGLSAAMLLNVVFRFSDVVADRLEQKQGLVGSATQRLGSFKMGFDIFSESPLVGVGFQGFFVRYGITGSETGRALGDIANANNQLIQVLADGGLLMLVIFVVFLWKIVRLVYRATLTSVSVWEHAFFAASFCWILGLALGNQSAVWFLPGALQTLLFWIVVGHALAAIRMAEITSSRIVRSQDGRGKGFFVAQGFLFRTQP